MAILFSHEWSQPMHESWQTFQAAFGRYLRDPQHETLPAGVVPRRAKVYEDLLFNNICGFLDNCFPVCQQLISQDDWRMLCRSFYRDWRCHSPRFNDIPKSFLDYLESEMAPPLAYPWFWSLAHYEWIELAVDIFDESSVNQTQISNTGIYANPSLHNLFYEWPVHRISPEWQPDQPQQTFIAVYRNSQHKVCFTEVNPATHALIHLFQTGLSSSEAALSYLAEQMQTDLNDSFKQFGEQAIQQLIDQGILIRSGSAI